MDEVQLEWPLNSVLGPQREETTWKISILRLKTKLNSMV
jgi:hypothetical protein